jgi:hypothetical protein
MSYITDVIVSGFVRASDESVLTAPLPFDERHQQLERISMEEAGGSKVFCRDVFAAAFNYLDLAAFESWIRELGLRLVVVMDTEGDVEVFSTDHSEVNPNLPLTTPKLGGQP